MGYKGGGQPPQRLLAPREERGGQVVDDEVDVFGPLGHLGEPDRLQGHAGWLSRGVL